MKRLLRIRPLMGMLVGALVLTAVVVVAQQDGTPRSYRFAYLGPQAGQEATQSVTFDVDLNMAITQSGQSISSSHRKINRTQVRTVKVDKVTGGHVSKAQVTFHRSEESMTEGGKPPIKRQQPVVKKPIRSR